MAQSFSCFKFYNARAVLSNERRNDIMDEPGVIYFIWNMINGKRYVGQTTDSLKKRMAQHKSGNLVVDKAIQKYGIKNFRYGVIKSCASREELNCWEKYFIAALKSKAP